MAPEAASAIFYISNYSTFYICVWDITMEATLFPKLCSVKHSSLKDADKWTSRKETMVYIACHGPDDTPLLEIHREHWHFKSFKAIEKP